MAAQDTGSGRGNRQSPSLSGLTLEPGGQMESLVRCVGGQMALHALEKIRPRRGETHRVHRAAFLSKAVKGAFRLFPHWERRLQVANPKVHKGNDGGF